MSADKPKRQQRGRIAPVTAAEMRDAKIKTAHIANVFAALEQQLDISGFDGELSVDGGFQLAKHLEALNALGGKLMGALVTAWPVPESVPESPSNTRNSESKSRRLSQSNGDKKSPKQP
jgi:hypothetical protein